MRLLLTSIITFYLMLTSSAFSANPVEGVWKSIDDQSKKTKSLVRLSMSNGRINGKVIKIIDQTYGANPLCTPCGGRQKNKPVLGMTVLRGFTNGGKGVWKGGTVLDPENGKIYKATLRVLGNGKRLELRGYWGPFYRTQIWRAQ